MASCVSVTSTLLVAPATAPAASLSSTKSVSFSNGGLRVSSLTAQRSPARRSLCIRAEGPTPDDENVIDKVKNAVADLTQGVEDAMPGKQSAASPGRKPGVGRQGQPEHKSSTGGITDAARDLAERTAVVFDGVRENVMDKLQDDGRDLKSKTDTVKYGAHRNAEGVPADVTQRNIKEQSEYTRNIGKKDRSV